MQWTKPEFFDLRFGFEITMYISNRWSLLLAKTNYRTRRSSSSSPRFLFPIF